MISQANRHNAMSIYHSHQDLGQHFSSANKRNYLAKLDHN
jgi:hypothetical protein